MARASTILLLLTLSAIASTMALARSTPETKPKTATEKVAVAPSKAGASSAAEVGDKKNFVNYGGIGGFSGLGANGLPFGGWGAGVGGVGALGGLGGIGGLVPFRGLGRPAGCGAGRCP